MTDDFVNPPGTSPPTSSALLEGIQAWDGDAWRRFLRLYGPLVYRWCRKAGLQEADAADVGQDVFRAVVGAVERFERSPGRGSFCGWLRTITANKIRDLARRNRARDEVVGGSGFQDRLHEVPDPAAGLPDDVPAEAVAEDRTLLLRRAIDLVLANHEERTRRVFLAVVVDGRHPTDVAAELGLSVNAVYLTKSRLLRQLRDQLAELAVLEPDLDPEL